MLFRSALIDDLLDVSRMAAGSLRLAIRDARISDTIQHAVEAVRPSASAKGVKIETNLDSSVGVVRADPDRLQQVILNLLSNALKFTPSGGTIWVSLSSKDKRFEVVVRDSGIGIKPEFLGHVFERFRQGEIVTSRQHTGLGLGLAIARQLVEMHRGTITADSAGEGKGATFTVSIPLSMDSHGNDAAQAGGDFPLVGILKGVDILLVEDERATGEAEQRFLEAAGAHVRSTDSAAAAREVFALRRPDLIVCDVGLPGEDGYTFMRSLRAQEQEAGTAPVPAVAVTAFARDADRRQALAAGFNEHLPKPLDPARLLKVLSGWVEKREV